MVGGAAILLSGCAAVTPQEGSSRLDYGGVLEFGLPVTSMLGRRFETVIRQQYDFSCGSAALATLQKSTTDDLKSAGFQVAG